MTTDRLYRRGVWWNITAFLVTNLCACVAWFYFFVLNRTTIVRRYRGSDAANLMFVANHQSPLDPFLVALAAFFPRTLWRPRLHPWCLAAAEYWFRTRPLRWLADHLRCIPVSRSRQDVLALRDLLRVLPGGLTVLFPEGRRSPDGLVREGFPGAGHVARQTRARIVPVAVDGLLDAMPYQRPRPRIGKQLRITFGDPVLCDDLYARPKDRETAQAIVDRTMAAVRVLHQELVDERVPAHVPERSNGRRGHRYRNKVVWITGASSGIGRSLALQMHRNGATLIVSARNRHQLRTLAAECAGQPPVHVLPLDLTDRDSLAAKVQLAVGKAGPIDCIIHNAGVAARDLAVDMPMAVDRQVMQTNYFGPVALTKALLPSMLDRRSGTIVVISSVTGKYGVPRMGSYAASKHALHGFFDSLRSELRDHDIQVTIAVPGFINTSITVNALTGAGGRLGKRMIAHLQGMEPDECARRILKGVAAGREEFLVGGVEIFSVPLLRVSRRLVAAIVRSHPVRFRETLRTIVSLGRYRPRKIKRRVHEDVLQMW